MSGKISNYGFGKRVLFVVVAVYLVSYVVVVSVKADWRIEEDYGIAIDDDTYLIMGDTFTFTVDQIRYGNGIYIGDYIWFNSTVNMTLTRYSSGWINYTVTGGVQEIRYYSRKPYGVYFDDVEYAEGTKWSFSSGLITVTPSGTTVSLDFNIPSDGDGTSPPVTEGYYNLTVYVHYADNSPVSNIKVSLSIPGGWWQAVTDVNGTAIFRNLVEGMYEVSVGNQTKIVSIPFYDSVTFTFGELPPPEGENWFVKNWPPLLIVISCIVLVVVVVEKKS